MQKLFIVMSRTYKKRHIKTQQLKDVKVSISAVQSFCSKHFNSNKVTAQNNTKSQKETIAQAITEFPSELPATTSKSLEAEVSEEIDEIPPHKRLPSWENIPGVKSIDDLI
ncbi:Uncharacterised protein [Oligella ureolytica]|uniref:hypothetical protein n=1 Tax=Oligella ureolytica TaxID=90244 RepID=UPI000E00A281|nr:hypothetical protein [Oligella ureolytica]SUA58899.1 Uncharacterised protein [Oligella ureolytica]